jgi:hypothetical protein
MSVPAPEVPLDNICSVIRDNTLYTYSAGAFQSIELTNGAEWKKLASGESVDGAACVNVVPADATQAALWIVGGQSSKPEYNGLQRYIYSTGTWETINSAEPVARNRRWHGAAYLKSTNQIVTYAGNTDGVQHISDSSFTIDTAPPYNVRAYSSTVSPPGTNPIVLPWSDSQIMMIGGSSGNTKIMLFNAGSDGWQDSGITMAEPMPKDTSVVKAVLVDGDDGSKNLLTFDMSEIPNKVQRTVLQGAGGAHITLATVVGSETPATPAAPALARRDLTVANWPKYNDTLAPEITRVNFAIAQGDDKVVLAGGNSQDPFSVYDVRVNTWDDTVKLLSDQDVLEDESSSSTTQASTTSTRASSSTASTFSTITTTSSTSTASSQASTTPSNLSIVSPAASATDSAAAAAGAAGSSGLDANAILGIVLGTITLAMLLLGLLLFCVRRKRLQRQALENNHNNLARAASSRRQVEKNMTSEFEKELAMGDASPQPQFRGGHQTNDSAGSFSSMAILMGQLGQKDGRKSTIHSPTKDQISKPMPMQGPGRSLTTNDEKGVSFAAGTGGQPRAAPPAGAADGTRRSSGWNRYWSGGSALNILGFGNQKRMTQESDRSSQYSAPRRITQDSATVPPLHLDGRPQMNRVMSGSPTVANWPNKLRLNAEQSGKIERPTSSASSGYSSGVPESIREMWDPTQDKKSWGADRAPSSVYTDSFYQHQPTPLTPSTKAPPMPEPKHPHMALQVGSSDMSWLNLGDLQKQGHGAYGAGNDSRV